MTDLRRTGRQWLRSILRSAGIQARRLSPYSDDRAALAAMLAHAQVDLILDVGGNVGQYAKDRLTNGYTGRIVTFEPLSAARAVLLRECLAYPHWQIAERCALGDHDGVVSMNVSQNSVASSALSPTNAHLELSAQAIEVGTEVVSMVRLDHVARQFVAASRAPFLKIDVQGFEEQVLLGSTEILPRLVGLQVELSFIPLYDGQKLFPEMCRLINSMGFTLHRMIPAWIEPKTGRWLQADGVFFRG